MAALRVPHFTTQQADIQDRKSPAHVTRGFQPLTLTLVLSEPLHYWSELFRKCMAVLSPQRPRLWKQPA